MSYAFRSDDRTVEAGLRRIALGQFEAARGELHSHRLGAHSTVHQLRKRCKKVRALVRLLRPAFRSYKRENAALRDMARPLSSIRDTSALIEAFDRLAGRFRGQVDARLVAQVRERLEARRARIDEKEIAARLEDFEKALGKAARRAETWKLDARGYAAIGKGLAQTYARARREYKAALSLPNGDTMHEWRKRVKYHRLQARLLKATWPPLMHAHIDAGEALSSLLGDHHDLIVFLDLLENGDVIDDAETRGMFRGLIDARQQRLAGEALQAGSFLFSEPPEALRQRWGGYWQAWKATG
jgi:CHAD domain-containing protein